MKTNSKFFRQILFFLLFISNNEVTFSQNNLFNIGEHPVEKFDIEHALEHLPVGLNQFQKDSFLLDAKLNWEKRQQNQQEFIRKTLSKETSNQLKSDPFNCNTSNWGFENGNFTNWNTSGCVSIVNSGLSPYSGTNNVYNGNGGSYSAKLSSDNSYGCQDGMISRNLNVPANGQTFFTFHFNLSIFNFPHSPNQAAKFKVLIYNNATGAPLQCPSYNAYYSIYTGPVGVSNLSQTLYPASFYNPNAVGAGFNTFNVSYTQDWNHVTMDLSSFAGQSISIFFIAEWCIFNVDWIYALVDMDCPVNTSNPQPVCVNQFPTTLCAPNGLNASLEWLDNNNTVLGTSNCLSVNNPGVYKLKITPNFLACNIQSNIILNYEVLGAPTANFQINDSCLYNEFTTNNLSLNATSYEWNYGTNTQLSTSYQGEYITGFNTIELIAFNGQCSDTIVHELNPFPIPQVSFDILNTILCSGETLIVSNSSQINSDENLLYQWETSTGQTSTNEDLGTIVFPPGDSWIELVGINPFGCKDTAKQVFNIEESPNADFTFQNKCLYDEYHFILNPGNDQNLNCQWNFGDGVNSTLVNPNHQYNSNQLFSVQLIVENQFGCKDTIVKNILPYLVPEANFTSIPACLYSDQEFKNTSRITDDSILSYEWDLGDGTFSNGQDVSHLYSENATYSIMLIATSNHGCSDTVIHNFNPLNTPIAHFIFDNQCLNKEYAFQNVSISPDGTRLNYSWNFGDGNESIERNPNHLYSGLGNYLVILIAESSDHCLDTFQLSASPFAIPIAQFTMNKTFLNEYDNEVQFTDVTTDNIVSWNWNLGDGNTATSSIVNHLYSDIANYSIIMEVTNAFGCSDTTIQNLQLQESIFVYVPNTFTPNGDEFNNHFKPILTGAGIDYSTYQIQLFNRWGQLIWESQNINDYWDGTLDGNSCQIGTYSWEISFFNSINEKTEFYRGHVNLVR